jgi:4-aminobutyrate aminotransferase
VVLAAALAKIAVLKEEDLIEGSRVQGDYFKEELLKLKKRHAFIGDVRGEGLSIGIDLVKNPETREAWGVAAKKISYRAWEKGLILTFFAGNVLRIQPPLSIPRDLITEALTRMAETFREFDRGEIPDAVLKTAKGW